MIRPVIERLAQDLAAAGHAGPVKLRLPRTAYEALWQEMAPLATMPTELRNGAQETITLTCPGGVTVEVVK